MALRRAAVAPAATSARAALSVTAATHAPESSPHPSTHRGSTFDVSSLHWSVEGAKQSEFQPHPVFDPKAIEDLTIEERPPKDMVERMAKGTVTLARSGFDLVSGYGKDMNRDKWLTRFIFLETVAGVPGMVGAMTRHLRSLAAMRRDRGWIPALLAEAENERMHLMTFINERPDNGLVFRAMVMGAQAVAWNLYFLGYLISPRFCHSFVGYLETEAVSTYTKAIASLDAGEIPEWTDKSAPAIAIKYWGLPKDATFRDMLLQVRADEAVHCRVNQKLSETDQTAQNPFIH
ncbi:hypothetical protein FNF29_00811 [Cafeteria roenbergensis]|uniref:Alternative oxidase n=1 Tax=Cafeteria roenbergensis TaxID=33653 RepID=A0A5A8CX15_CAFRO|nr:hypothetical protein FNF29_00811 [Cafeteria roenbergensis]|eukprot:KAA0156700.1 hypothetical protein FNF29_00811 [Cafeteria roenbergensis]